MDELRKQAEEILRTNQSHLSNLTQLELHKLIEELQIHQIELHVQNEELRENRIELEISKSKYFNLFDKAPIGYLILDAKGIILELNLKASEIFNRRKDHTLNRAFVSLLDAQSISLFYECFDNIKENKSNIPFQLLLSNEHKKTYVELTISPYYNEQYLTAIVDITENKKKEQEIIQYTHQLKKLQKAVEQSPVTIAITDTNGIIEYVNPAFCEITGYTSEEAMGANPKVLKSDLTPPETFKELWKTINSGNTWQGEFINKKKNGEMYFEEAIISPVKDNNNNIINYIAVKTDITIRKQHEEQIRKTTEELKEHIKTKDKFFGIIAHDLKNPFQCILGFSEILLKNIDHYPKEKIHLQISHIHSAANNTYKLLTNLLDWASFQKGIMPFNPESVPLISLIEDILPSLANQASIKQMHISNNIFTRIWVFVDSNMIKTVLRNLISNAIKFSFPESTIDIKSKIDSTSAIISIVDRGVGIDSESMTKLFSVELNQSTLGTQSETGTGLGLILCKDFVEKNGGKIWVESEIEKGSTFLFSIPLGDIK